MNLCIVTYVIPVENGPVKQDVLLVRKDETVAELYARAMVHAGSCDVISVTLKESI